MARRYAKALFAVGKKVGEAELASFGKDLAALDEALKASPELLRVFKNPIIGIEEKKAVVGKVLDSLDAGGVVKNFCSLLADKDRLGNLPEIAAVYRDILDAEQGIVRGECLTAVDLDTTKQDEIKKALETQLKDQKLVLDFAVDPSILGGVKLKVGDKILDASLKAQLSLLKDQIKRGE